jgi:hypothetical protein
MVNVTIIGYDLLLDMRNLGVRPVLSTKPVAVCDLAVEGFEQNVIRQLKVQRANVVALGRD